MAFSTPERIEHQGDEKRKSRIVDKNFDYAMEILNSQETRLRKLEFLYNTEEEQTTVKSGIEEARATSREFALMVGMI